MVSLTGQSQVRNCSDSSLISYGQRVLIIGGPELAAHAFRAGLIDECHLFLVPILVGGGKSALPDNVRMELELLAERRFRNGTVYLRYRTRQGSATGTEDLG